jgi:two-component system response regulator HupR/HoxA
MGAAVKPLEAGALDLLCAYSWPGNVRELANEVRRALALAGGRITAETLSDRVRGGGGPPAVEVGPGRGLRDVVEDVEKAVIARELSRHGGNKTRAADALGLSRLGLRNKIHRYGL